MDWLARLLVEASATVGNNTRSPDPTAVSHLIRRWIHERQLDPFPFSEEMDPQDDPNGYDDYQLSFRAALLPAALDRMQVHVRLTTDNAVGIGVESQSRIARRLGVRCLNSQRYAGGSELTDISGPGLIALLDLIAGGQLGIKTTVLPLIGLVSTKAVVEFNAFKKLVASSHPLLAWLQIVDERQFHHPRVLHFQPWPGYSPPAGHMTASEQEVSR